MATILTTPIRLVKFVRLAALNVRHLLSVQSVLLIFIYLEHFVLAHAPTPRLSPQISIQDYVKHVIIALLAHLHLSAPHALSASIYTLAFAIVSVRLALFHLEQFAQAARSIVQLVKIIHIVLHVSHL